MPTPSTSIALHCIARLPGLRTGPAVELLLGCEAAASSAAAGEHAVPTAIDGRLLGNQKTAEDLGWPVFYLRRWMAEQTKRAVDQSGVIAAAAVLPWRPWVVASSLGRWELGWARSG